ncbi:glycine--tRNA ligase subunit beta [Peribacillus cavernae]|uniref:Glycine--tRNA ligase beta subunit n=1 Tax=Peribacillus cavernae TaxID=1674310 RepID=A0A433HJV5_9BACI|nr:glycine--tRNA ligase subunit beta [Peribacillus cavernae]MDQ0218272.1 glycyl-tRNA synthetase beta chain [Peribacillus cavernae]RUQ28443.1 glycine--tRNA ligase subunit beta [Peribacillus cavernae]
MAKHDLLVEIGLEEMPARFVTSSMNQLSKKMEKWLNEKAIEFDHINMFSTPRRLAVLVKGVAEAQKDIHEEAKGPAKKIARDESGNWSKAAIGFTRGQGVSVDDIYFKEVGGVEYVHVNKFIKGQPSISLLPELKEMITSMSFPKNMRWADQDLRYIRPIKWIIALFGNKIIPLGITHVTSGNETRGHRFLGGPAAIEAPEQYEAALSKQFVVADPVKRKNMILDGIKKLEDEQGWDIPVDEDLLEEVNNLVEYPTVLFGGFEKEFLELPQEVLITSMKEHQRYFPVKNQNGELLPFFVTVRNGDSRHLEIVSKGNEKVLRARLSDASFFYKEDQKKDIDSALKKLETIVYHEEIGTLSEKMARVRKLTAQLSSALQLSENAKKLADRAAEIAKFDLVSHMVYEFPELQGYMGEKYAKLLGEPQEVAAAINEHYMPRHAIDSVPPSLTGAILSVAEKMDTIVTFFSIGIIPTGSQDPYALRRQASGIVQILSEKKWELSLEKIMKASLGEMEAKGIMKRDRNETLHDLEQFFKARVKHLLNEQGIRYDLIDALLENEIGNIAILSERASVLEVKKQEAGFKENLEALSRVINIAVKCENKVEVSPALFENKFEAKLYEKYQAVYADYQSAGSETRAFELLVSLKAEIEDYFEHTMVMADDDKLRKNRLSLMKDISDLISGFAAMNKIIVS